MTKKRTLDKNLPERTANKIINRLYIAGCYAADELAPNMSMHVVCIKRKRLPPTSNTLYIPFADQDWLWEKETKGVKALLNVAYRAAHEWRQGKTVLVSCYSGYNRSALVVALALCLMGAEPDKVVSLIRAKRGQKALSNDSFVSMILSKGKEIQGKYGNVKTDKEAERTNDYRRVGSPSRALRVVSSSDRNTERGGAGSKGSTTKDTDFTDENLESIQGILGDEPCYEPEDICETETTEIASESEAS